MLVKALCTARAWDNETAREFLPGLEYEIPSDSKLADLTVVPVAYDEQGRSVRYYRDRDGNMKTIPVPKPAYVFQFDRNITRTNEGVVVEKDYSCKEEACPGFGMKFKTLNALGNHSNKWHKDLKLIKDDSPDEEPELKFVCDKCEKRFKDRRGLVGHLRWSHKNEEVTDAVTVT